MDLHLPHGNKTGKKIGLFFRIRLMYDSLIALTGCSGLIGVYSGNQDQLVLYLFVYLCKTGHIFADSILIICGTGTDDHEKLVAFAGNDISDLTVSFFF